MALEQILTDGTETGESAAGKINAAIVAIETPAPKGAMSASAPAQHILNDTTWEIANFDTAVTSRGGVSVDLTANTITVTDAGNYMASFGVDSDFPQQEEIVISFFINGVEIDTTPFSLQGAGNGKPVAISWTTTVPFEAGDVLDMRLMNGDPGTFTANIRRMFLSLTKDV